MYDIKKESFGFKLTFGGFIKEDEMSNWVNESRKNLIGTSNEFGVVIDMIDLKPLPKDSQSKMQEGQKLFKQKGMKRSAVILNNSITTMQFKRIAKETGIYEWERYIDASKNSNYESMARQWVSNGIDPDKN